MAAFSAAQRHAGHLAATPLTVRSSAELPGQSGNQSIAGPVATDWAHAGPDAGCCDDGLLICSCSLVQSVPDLHPTCDVTALSALLLVR